MTSLVDTVDTHKKISTHTLTWSVTMPTATELAIKYAISTHTLTWSVTCFWGLD